MKKLILALVGAMTVVTALMLAPGVQAEERVCRGNLGNRTVDNVRVPQNATCTMNGTTVQGTVKVENGATLRATDIRVIGNIQGENHKQVTVRSSHIGGSLQLNQGGGAVITGNRIVHTLYFDSNNNPITARNNNIGDNLQAFQNRGGVTISNNRIDGNLQCKENSPRPVGGGNIVQGVKEDQCKNL